MVRLFARFALLLMACLATSAEGPDPVIPGAASAGNLPADFYVTSGCARPEAIPVVKPSYSDRAAIDIYNAKVRRYNEAGKAFAACINAYVDKAPNDIAWILFTVNAAIARANGSNPPAAPSAPGNMPADFYPAPVCFAPAERVDTVPDPRNAKAMDVHNTKVRTFNALAGSFNDCINGYKARAQADIARIEEAENTAALEAKNP
jgi:hypothetical protein